MKLAHAPSYRVTTLAMAVAAIIPALAANTGATRAPAVPRDGPHRSPIALALSADGSRLLTANQTSNSVSLVDVANGKVLAEIETGEKPAGVAFAPDGKSGIVTHWYGYDAAILSVDGETLDIAARVTVGPEPRGVVIAPDGQTAYVAVGAANEVARIDLTERKVDARVTVGREPRGLALSRDGALLAVGNARGGSISIIETRPFQLKATTPIDGANLRQVTIDSDAKFAYVANMKNLRFATTKGNIDQGWVLGQRVSRVPLDGEKRFETLSIDPRGKAASDAHGVAISPTGDTLAVSLGGTHEVMIFRATDSPLPWRDNGSRDLIAPELLKSKDRFQRVALGGRPTEVVFAPDGRTLYVANYLLDAIRVVDTASAKITNTIALGGPAEPSLERRGEALFHDGTRSFNQWYSCNTCHSDGHTNGLDFDTLNDGWQDVSTLHRRSRKKVPTLRGTIDTGPWTWHGWQTSLEDAMVESFTKSMQGPQPSKEDVEAIVAYIRTLQFPPNPFRAADGSISEAAQRGEVVFRSGKAACANCHGGPHLTDGKVHDLDLGERGDVYTGHNPPSLRGVYDKDPYMHDGRSPDMRDTLTKWHNPDDVTGAGSLSEDELADLIEYLKTL